MGKIFNVVLNSSVDSVDGTSSTIENFYHDFSTMDEGRYKVTWSFISAVNSVELPTGQYVANVFIDLGQGAYVNIASSANNNQGRNYSANFVGSLEFRSFTTTTAGASTSYGFYSASTTTNPPFYLDNKPRNNLVTVSLFSNQFQTSSLFTPPAGIYTLILSFHKEPDEPTAISYKPKF